jgi:hypothetical protein
MKHERKLSAAAIVALFVGVGAAPLVEAHETGGAAKLGKLNFPVECNAAAQKEFNLAMAYYHSFAWEVYKAPLERVLQADPTCGMAHWVRALGMLDNPFVWPANLSPQILNDGQAALDAARKTGLKTQRERDYVEALAAFFKDYDKLNHRARAQALEVALEQVAQRYPDDKEATILYALVLSSNFDPADKKYTNQLKAAKTLEPIFVAQPDHPGVAHYLIHSYDYPPLAKQGLEAAKRYSKIAPDAAHALHMPSHIFSRVGYWRESIEANRASADAAKGSIPNKVHALDYMVFAQLQLGQDRAAAASIAEAKAIAKPGDHFATAYGFAAMSARYALERGAWKEAADLPLYPAADAYGWQKFPQAEAINAFARGVGAAMNKDPANARVALTRLQQVRETAAALKITYWVEQIDIQTDMVRGLATYAEGKHDEAIAMLRKAAEREEATEKHVVTPGLIVPAREVLGRVMLEVAKPADALREFEAVIEREPNRYRAFAGALEAAERAGEAKKTAHYSARLIELTASADTPRAEVAHAKRLLGK